MNTFKHTAPADDPQLRTTSNMYARLSTVEAKLAAKDDHDVEIGPSG